LIWQVKILIMKKGVYIFRFVCILGFMFLSSFLFAQTKVIKKHPVKEKLTIKQVAFFTTTACFVHYNPVDTSKNIIITPRLAGHIFELGKSLTGKMLARIITITDNSDHVVTTKDWIALQQKAERQVFTSTMDTLQCSWIINRDTLIIVPANTVNKKEFLIVRKKDGRIEQLIDKITKEEYTASCGGQNIF
jgi:hypothetical protein